MSCRKFYENHVRKVENVYKKTLDTSCLESGERLTRALIQMSCPQTGNEFMNWKNRN